MYTNIEDQNLRKNEKLLIFFDDMTAQKDSSKSDRVVYPWNKTISVVFNKHSYFKVSYPLCELFYANTN